MDKDTFIKLAVINFAAWCYHPGYSKPDSPPAPTPEEIVRKAEELWDILVRE